MIGLFIGRFQPFHNGHLNDIIDALKIVDKLIIAIGSSQESNTFENPFSADERKDMIDKTLKDSNIKNYKIVFVPDIQNDEEWVNHVAQIVGDFDVVFTKNPKTEALFSQQGYNVHPVKFIVGINGTTVRENILNDKDWEKLVPSDVGQYIKRVSGIERIKQIGRF